MHDTLVKMKDGRVFCGPLYTWRPREGYFTIPSETDEKIYFRDVESAVTKADRINIHTVGDRDELARAREEGWDGK